MIDRLVKDFIPGFVIAGVRKSPARIANPSRLYTSEKKKHKTPFDTVKTELDTIAHLN
jgi:hypothetical protein